MTVNFGRRIVLGNLFKRSDHIRSSEFAQSVHNRSSNPIIWIMKITKHDPSRVLSGCCIESTLCFLDGLDQHGSSNGAVNRRLTLGFFQ